MSVEDSAVCLRGGFGVVVTTDPSLTATSVPTSVEGEVLVDRATKRCRASIFSANGARFAFIWDEGVDIWASSPSWTKLCSLPTCKPYTLSFSPHGTFLGLWQPYTTAGDDTNKPNLTLWRSDTGQKVAEHIQKRQIGWEPEWSVDEKLMVRMVNNEVHFFEVPELQMIKRKIHLQKVASYALSPTPVENLHVACYVPGTKGAPSFVRVYRYPNFDGPGAALANKSFYKADNVSLYWNKDGSSLLVLTSTEVDVSGTSYYGEQVLHFMDLKGTSAIVQLNRDGPIYSVAWEPSQGRHFAVVYGYMPARAALINLKCEIVHDFGQGPRNQVAFNPQGSALYLAGFGNLRGNIEVYSFEGQRLPPQKIVQFQAPDSTSIEWNPHGDKFLTATTSPRLRTANGYKVWLHNGKLLMSKVYEEGIELWEAIWRPIPKEGLPMPHLILQAAEEVVKEIAAKKVYVPPFVRDGRGVLNTKGLHEEDDGKGPTPLSKSAQKNQKRKGGRGGGAAGGPLRGRGPGGEPEEAVANGGGGGTAVADEKEKKVKKLKRQLDAIEKLKEQQESGKVLEKNQLEKLSKEEEFRKELEALVI